jgi:hypothetical protein
MATFPAYAKVLAENYSKSRASAVVRTPIEDGMVKQTRYRARVLVARSVTLGFESWADYDNFITWFQDTIDYGAAWFDFTDPEDSVVRSVRIVSKLDAENPIFGAGIWRVPVTIETWSG